ncbi:MAG: hypothetical protein A2V93_09720 [Ignavibacteria bacterium RBG_16_34_14]|nr:MAG: hypothetical protein A2V93_09720 [Ignavibacteria bacterium RBG_16_34_14]
MIYRALKDESLKDVDDLIDPQVLASEANTEPESVIDGLKDVLDELESNGNGKNNGSITK